MKKIMMSVVVVAMLIGMMSCSGIGPDMTPDVTVTKVVIDQSDFTVIVNDPIPTVTATVFYSDGTSDNDVTIIANGNTDTANVFNIVATSNEDNTVSDSVSVTVNTPLYGTVWADAIGATMTFTNDNVTVSGTGVTNGPETTTYTYDTTTITFSFTANTYFNVTGINDNTYDGANTPNTDSFELDSNSSHIFTLQQ